MVYFLVPVILPFYFFIRYRMFALVLLILAITVSPRFDLIPLAYGRILQLRFEDFLLVILLVSWLFSFPINKKSITPSPLTKPILIYVFLAVLSTLLGIYFEWVEPTRAFFYLFKEIEYFLIYFVFVMFIENFKNLRVIIITLLVLGIGSGIFAAYQFVTGKLTGYYGIASIGEPSPFSTGGYYSILFIFSVALFLHVKEKKIRWLSAISILLNFLALINSGSRANVIGTIFSLCLLLLFIYKPKMLLRLTFIIPIFISAWIIIMFFSPSEYIIIERITNVEGMKLSWEARIDKAFIPLWNVVVINPVTGLGKSITGTEGLPTEAHNHYLRILTEMGVIGIISFLYLLSSIIKTSIKTYKNTAIPLKKATALCCLLVTISLMVASISQDAFTPVKVNEMFWLLVGLMTVAYQLNLREIKAI